MNFKCKMAGRSALSPETGIFRKSLKNHPKGVGEIEKRESYLGDLGRFKMMSSVSAK